MSEAYIGVGTPYLRAEQELASISDDAVYVNMQSQDYLAGRWTLEDPSLGAVQRWVRTRPHL